MWIFRCDIVHASWPETMSEGLKVTAELYSQAVFNYSKPRAYAQNPRACQQLQQFPVLSTTISSLNVAYLLQEATNNDPRRELILRNSAW
jgi:hypothetical protein